MFTKKTNACKSLCVDVYVYMFINSFSPSGSPRTHRCEGSWSGDEVRWCRSVITCLVQQVSRCRCSRRTPPLGQQALAWRETVSGRSIHFRLHFSQPLRDVRRWTFVWCQRYSANSVQRLIAPHQANKSCVLVFHQHNYSLVSFGFWHLFPILYFVIFSLGEWGLGH